MNPQQIRFTVTGSLVFNAPAANDCKSFREGYLGWCSCLVALLLVATQASITAGIRETPVVEGVTGVWSEHANHSDAGKAWRAQWIWTSGSESTDMMLARRSFALDRVPESARLRITASSLYQLHVNGAYVLRGPARCAPHHQSFDELDISGLLQPGRNTLAVRVHHQRGTVSYYHQGRPGLLAQLDLIDNGHTRTISTDSTWRVMRDLSWDDNAPRMSRFHSEVCDRVDLRHAIDRGWTRVAFDDGGWPSAAPLHRVVGWPSPQPESRPHAITPPWTSLVRRDIPYLREQVLPVAELIDARPIAGPGFHLNRSGEIDPAMIASVKVLKQIDPGITEGGRSFRERAGSLVMAPSDSADGWFLLFDFGSVRNGMPRLDIEGPAGTVIDVMSAPFMIDETFTANIVDSQFIDRIILSGQRSQWEATYFMPTRYLGIAIHGAAAPVKLHGAGLLEIAYPFEKRGVLRTPENPWFEACWDAAARTIEVCTTDAYTDNYRERRQYVQTAYYAALGNYWTFGDTALQRRCLLQAAQEQEANGMMPAYAPRVSDDFMVLLDSNTAWVRSLHDYLLYSGDETTVGTLVPAGRKLMALLHSYTDSRGLLVNPPYAYWLDHARIDRRGANFRLNGHYLGALEDFAQMLRWIELPGAEEFEDRAARLRSSLRQQFWNPHRQLFCDALVDGAQSESFSEHANAMALAARVATEEQAGAVAVQLLERDKNDFVQRASGITMVTPAMSHALHLGLCRYGYVRESMALLQQRFSHMLDPATNRTLWEEWWLDGSGRTGRLVMGRTRSDAQTESAFPPALFGEFLLGLRPLTPGVREVLLSRPRSGQNEAGGVMPTPRGNLTVSWNMRKRLLSLQIPPGTQVHLDCESFEFAEREQLSVDGQPLGQSAFTSKTHTLDQGNHHVQF